MLFYLDDSGFWDKTTRSDVACIGGFLVRPRDIQAIESILQDTKEAYGIPRALPVKWNFKDSMMRSTYTKAFGEERYKELVSQSDSIRETIIQRFSELETVVIMSTEKQSEEEENGVAMERAFRYLLQRFGLELQEENKIKPDNEWIHLLIMDRDNTNANLFCETYDKAYREGTGFFSGPLSMLSVPGVSFSVTQWNPLLQMADIVVGCTAHFLKMTLNEESMRPPMQKMFLHLLKNFRKDPKSREVYGRGLVIPDKTQRERIIRALSALGAE